MPFKSQAQRRFLYATNPKVAEKFSKHTPKGKRLPDRVKQAWVKIAAPVPGVKTMSTGMPPMMPLGGLANATGRLSATKGLSGAYNVATRKPNVVKSVVNRVNSFMKKRLNQ